MTRKCVGQRPVFAPLCVDDCRPDDDLTKGGRHQRNIELPTDLIQHTDDGGIETALDFAVPQRWGHERTGFGRPEAFVEVAVRRSVDEPRRRRQRHHPARADIEFQPLRCQSADRSALAHAGEPVTGIVSDEVVVDGRRVIINGHDPTSVDGCRTEETQSVTDLVQHHRIQVHLTEAGSTLGGDVPIVAEAAVELDQDLGVGRTIDIEIGHLIGECRRIPPIGRELVSVPVLPLGACLSQQSAPQVRPHHRDLHRSAGSELQHSVPGRGRRIDHLLHGGGGSVLVGGGDCARDPAAGHGPVRAADSHPTCDRHLVP